MDSLLSVMRRFISVSEEEEMVVRDCFKTEQLQPRAYFLEEGKICRHAGFICKGLVRYFTTRDGEERTMSFNKENEFISYYPSFLTGHSSDVSIQAVEPTELYTISRDALQRVYRELKEGERFGRLAAEHIYLAAMEALHSLYTDPPPDRYRRFIQLHPDLVQRIPQYYIASFVGVKPQSLSRIRRKLAATS